MIMLGNDIVDLKMAKSVSNWRRKNFLSKIFTPEEQSMVCKAENPDMLVWVLWSMKESAYKIVNRISERRFYNPQAFFCNLILNEIGARGTINYNGEEFLSISEIRDDFIHTTAIQKDILFKNIDSVFCANHSGYISEFNCIHRELQLIKNQRNLPEIVNLKEKTKHVASVSHHGDYLAIVFLKK